MDRLLINPTLDEVNAALTLVCAAANKGQRSRTAEMQISSEEWQVSPVALYRAGGRGVANSYRQSASTTVVGCCWVPFAGGRVVRVQANRTYAPKSPFGERSALPFGYNTAITHWRKADEGAIILNDAAFAGLRAELDSATAFADLSTIERLATLPVIADWLDDKGLPSVAVREWIGRVAPVESATA